MKICVPYHQIKSGYAPASESREQRLITKEHIATHANLILLFKPALYSSTLVIKLFESSIKLFYAEILTVTP